MTRKTMESGLLAAFVGWLIDRRGPLLVLAIVLTLLAIPVAQRLSFEQNIESLYAKDDPQLQHFLQSKEWFGGDEFAIVAYQDADLFADEDFALTDGAEERIRNFAAQLSAVPGVNPESTQHLANALRFKYGRAYMKKVTQDFLVGRDNRTTAVVLRLLPEEESPVARGETIARIRALADAHEPPAYVVGEPIQIHDMFRIVQQDADRLFYVSLLVLSGVILLLFRSLRWVVLPIVVVVFTIVWTEATMVLTRFRLSMVSSMLYSMVTIIGIATVTHVIVHYLHARRTMDRSFALRTTLVNLLPAVFWTCATTAVGFAALLSSQVTPVRSFGLMMALASIFVLGATAVVLPGGIMLGNSDPVPPIPREATQLTRLLHTISGWIEGYPLTLALMGFGVLLATLPGLFLLEIETDFSRNFRETTPIVKALNFVEQNLGGAGTWEVNFPAPQELTPEFLERVARVSGQLAMMSDEDGNPAVRVAGLTEGLALIPNVPLMADTIDKRMRILSGFQKEFVPSLYDQDEGRMRIMLRGRERQRSEAKIGLIEEADRIVKAEFGSDAGAEETTATGIFVLLAFIIQSLLSDQLVSFAWAAVGIVTMMTLAFRSPSLGLVSLIPNIFPIVLVIGTMGWLGFPVNIGTAMIASVSMGLTVDSTIHYISGFQRLRADYSVDEALRRTHQEVGRALVFAYLALMAGFTVLALSQFIPLVYFGVVLSLAMLGGLIGDLLLLPVLLRWLENRKPPKIPKPKPLQAVA